MDDLKISVIKRTVKKKVPVIIINAENEDELKQFDEYLVNDRFDNYVLVGLYGYDWNRDLSPWPAKAVFRNGEGFKGEADLYLKKITDKIIPDLNIDAEYYGIAGYSLAGLFALYAGYSSDVFTKIVSASGSLWYPDFLDFARNNSLSDKVECLYLSLGGKEASTKNPVMASVEDNTRIIYEMYKNEIKCTLEMNEGNHFKDATYRLYKGLRYILSD